MRRWNPVRLAMVSGVVAACLYFVRRWDLRWGATAQEARRPLPGDEAIPHPNLSATRAITIRAPANQVWPWIAQMGQGRGGFYSYDFLENLAGCDIHSANRIVPEWQDVSVGDAFRLHPKVALEVAAVEPGRSLVIRGGDPMDSAASPYIYSWAFTLLERPDGMSRLLVRERYGFTRWWSSLLVEPLGAISFIMSQKMLRGIRERAERASHSMREAPSLHAGYAG